MKPHSTFSPISLRYIAALRGNKPKKTGAEFTYADLVCAAPEKLICLAASNPEGRFYGFVADDTARRAAENIATQRGTFNIIFMTGSPSEALARLDNGSSLPPMLDYLCCDESAAVLSTDERKALFTLAQKRLNPGGLFVTSYRAYDREDGALRFLVQELTPEMNAAQKQEFLSEIKQLGARYLARRPDLADALDKAIADKNPQAFFALFDGASAVSTTFNTLVAARTHGLSYAGDATLVSNYVELAVPAQAQDLVVSCRAHPLYEPIKDLALDRAARSDIWIKEPVSTSASAAELFGGFAYGLVVPAEQVPPAFAAQGKVIDLSGELYAKIISLMSITPLGVGDILAHPAGQGEKPEKILEALQVLVACGFAIPMRGAMTLTNKSNINQPRLVGSFNRFLDRTALSDQDVLFASQVVGCGVALSARDAFVIQAVNRGGLDNSVSALMPELRRIANTQTSLSIIRAEEPTAEIAHSLILDIVGKSLPQWYAYALLEAA
ncbi:MAG: methyltransferase regulatory domain-containing protein [Alphaproteobacteria bacterium]|nr:methyltransferase regulatory domain-containing protein [Alphaproteobacteria bacterium]